MERMDQTLQAWLAQHGQRNLFDVMSEDECRDLLNNLEARLSEETQLAEAAHSLHALVQQGQERPSDDSRLTPPHGLPAIQEAELAEDLAHGPEASTASAAPQIDAPDTTASLAPDKPAMPRRSWIQIASMACGVLLMGGWSLALYQWGYHQGSHQAHKTTNQQLAFALRTHLLKKHELKSKAQAPLALHHSYKLVEPLRLDNPTPPAPRPVRTTSTTSAALTALATKISLRSPLLGQSSQKEPNQFKLQWPLRDGIAERRAEPPTVALRASIELEPLDNIANAQNDWDARSRRLALPPRQLPSSDAFGSTSQLDGFTSTERPLY